MKLASQDNKIINSYLQNGLTLVELLIVVAIVGILAGIAYPSYQNHITSTRHADAKTKLLEIMQLQRRYFTSNNSYTDKLVDDLGLPDAGEKKVATDNEFYLIEAKKCIEGTIELDYAECIQLEAVPNYGDSTDTPVTYNSKNIKSPNYAW